MVCFIICKNYAVLCLRRAGAHGRRAEADGTGVARVLVPALWGPALWRVLILRERQAITCNLIRVLLSLARSILPLKRRTLLRPPLPAQISGLLPRRTAIIQASQEPTAPPAPRETISLALYACMEDHTGARHDSGSRRLCPVFSEASDVVHARQWAN